MSTQTDSLDLKNVPDRVFYELGVMLDKKDFTDEQTYHRGRLARVLAFLHGAGTLAGLRVEVKAGDLAAPETEEVQVHPGLAIDEVGRLIELSSLRCTRLKRWLDDQTSDPNSDAGQRRAARLASAFRPDAPASASGSIIVDVFLRFAACPREHTPAFASGPFDALNAVQPARVRDGFEIQLVPREELTPPLPLEPWPAPVGATPEERQTNLEASILEAWERFRPKDQRAELDLDPEPLVPAWFDPFGERHWLLLARLAIPALSVTDAATARTTFERDTAQAVAVDNHIRPFVYTSGAVLRLLSV